MAEDSYSPGGYDWLAIWRRMYDEERNQAESATLPGFVAQPDCWSGQADRFAAAAQRAPQPDGFMRFLLPLLRPSDRLIDIGAGTGRYEPLLAAAVAELLAVEPSPSMRAQLERRLADERLTNVHAVAGAWPDIDVPPCDVAIAAHVLYGVREIEPFLRAMDAAASRACFLLLAFRHPSSFVSPFWERLYGVPRLPLPGALECLNALYQLGIAARLELVPVTSRLSYTNQQEALADLRWRLRTPPQPEYDRQILAAIDELLDRVDDGRLAPRGLSAQAAVIWWERLGNG
ncbi:MAG TPA: methyltransferase [Roseiflexaceae bacterium]|nr:methyltransferase [Roseiflexaceae bacterium]